MTDKELTDQTCINTMRTLALDAVRANLSAMTFELGGHVDMGPET